MYAPLHHHSICCNNISKINKICVVVAAAAVASTRFASRFSLEAHAEEERDPGSDTQKYPLGTAASLLVLLHLRFLVCRYRERQTDRGSSGQTVCPCLHPCCCCNLGCMLVRELEKALYVCRLLFLLRQRFDQVECSEKRERRERERERERECVCVCVCFI